MQNLFEKYFLKIFDFLQTKKNVYDVCDNIYVTFIYFFKNVSFSIEETATQRRLRACDPFISSVYFLVS